MSEAYNRKRAEYDRIKKEVLTKYSEILLEKLVAEENCLEHYLSLSSVPHRSVACTRGRIDMLRFALGQLNLSIGEDEIMAYRKEYEVDGKLVLQFRKM